jgi:D-alanyl-D-alanine carboxypeptidase
MVCVRLEATRWLRWGLFSFVVALSTVSVSTSGAARSRQALTTDNPRYACLVFDVNSGATMRQANADSLRHPASLTKIMTLYLLFERIESGKLKLNSPVAASAKAASQSPTKLGLKPGQIIQVEDAIKALVTKSANDAAVVVAEALAGSEDEFAREMTRNASGLPDDEQVTTARDQARLAIAIQERFPRFYRYFSLTSFTYRGETMRNHNHLLGHVAGVDGIKTGYTNASGFNLVTSVRRGARHIVGVVLGGDTGAQRDAHMRDLIDRYIVEASVKLPATQIAQAPAKPDPRMEARAEVKLEPRAEAPAAPRPETPAASRAEPPIVGVTAVPYDTRPKPRIMIVPVLPTPSETAAAIIPTPGSNDPINPTVVKTFPIKSALTSQNDSQLTAYAPAPELSPAAIEARRLPSPAENPTYLPDEQPPAETVTGNIAPAAPGVRAAKPAGDQWIVQVGAFDQEIEAQHRITVARAKAAALLKTAKSYTESTTKGDKTLYRARFSGFDRTEAHAVCKHLQQSDVSCIALRI